MAIPEGIIIMWDGDHSGWPTGWVRETGLDDLFIKGTADGVTPNVTGGNAAHVHADPGNHTHTVAAHGHNATSTEPVKIVNANNFNAEYGAIMMNNHVHGFSSTNNVTGGTSSNPNTTAAWDSQTTEANHFEPIFIKSDGTPSGFPQDSQVFSKVSTLPEGWAQHTASRGLFLKGAPTGSGHGGGGSGNAGTHAHAGPTHTHTTVAHTPGGGNASAGGLGYWYNNSYTGTWTNSGPYTNNRDSGNDTHTHSTAFAADDSGTSGTSPDATANETNSPPFFTLWMLDNQSAGTDYPELEGIIVMWLGSLTDDVVTTDGWELCDGTDNGWDSSTNTPDLRGKYIKVATSSGDITGTGGSAGHDHDAGGHTHTTGGHTHTANLGQSPNNNPGQWRVNVSGDRFNVSPHAHQTPANQSSSSSPVLESGGGAAATTSDTQPAFRTVAFLHMPEAAAGGGAVMFGTNF
jgi:hypothetical protein